MAGSLAIDRFELVGLAAGDHPDPGRLKSSIQRIDRQRLKRTIGSALGDFGSNDTRCIALSRLDLTIAEGALEDADGLAGKLAQGIRTAITDLAVMAPTQNMVVFASRAARMAAFIVAAGKGDAWGKWWFSDLDHLKLLPLSSAIRVALGRDPGDGLQALRELSESDRTPVLGCLSEIDAEELLKDFDPLFSNEGSERCWIDAFALPRAPTGWPRHRTILHDLAALSGNDLPSRAAITALQLRAALAQAQDPLVLFAALRAGSTPLLGLPSRIKPSILEAFGALSTPTRDRIESLLAAGPVPSFTPFGGVLLLWGHLPDLGGRLPDGPGNPRGILGLIGFSSLFGARNASKVLADGPLREILGIDPDASEEQLANWLSSVAPDIFPKATGPLMGSTLPRSFSVCREQSRRVRQYALAALAEIARRLPGFSTAKLTFLRANLFDIPARLIVGETSVRAILGRPPLDVLLSMSGLADRTTILPDGRLLELEREA